MPKYRHYIAEQFPLEPIDLEAPPTYVIETFDYITKTSEYIIQGGAALYFLTKEKKVISDFDISVPELMRKTYAIHFPNLADHFFYSQNHLGNDVATLFWASGKKYHKVEVCFCSILPAKKYVNYKINDYNLNISITTCTWLWLNKIEKIGRQYTRQISNDKLICHARAVISLGKLLLEMTTLNIDISQKQLFTLVKNAKQRIETINDTSINNEFRYIVKEVYKRHIIECLHI